MDEEEHGPAPDPEHTAQEVSYGGSSSPPDDTTPQRPAAGRSTHEGVPPSESPAASTATPPPPDTGQAPALQASEPEPGLQRAIQASNLDAVAQADPNVEPDRYSAAALLDMVNGGAIPVPVTNVERELIQVWKSTTSGGENEGKVAVTLMRVMNLVVYVEGEEQADRLSEVIARVVGRHPCRTIMIVNRAGASPREGGDLEAFLSAHCELTEASGKHVCCEQVSVLANTPAALDRVSNVALNLLITDLPVFLWWVGSSPLNNPVLEHLRDSVDRLIVDSSLFSDPLAGLLSMARATDPALRQSRTIRYAPSDFSWDRLAGWRDALASFFDKPDLTPALWRIGSIEIQYAAPEAGAEPNPVQPFLLAGWLAGRLGWEFHSSAAAPRGGPGDYVVTVRQNIRSIPVVLQAVAAGTASAGGLVSVSLTTNDSSPVTFLVRPAGDGVYLDCRVERERQPPAEHKIRYSDVDAAGLLDLEMELFGRDEVFEQSLALAGTMAWASLSFRKRSELSAQLGTEQRNTSFDPRF